MVVALGIAGLSAVYLICGYEYNDGLAFQVLAGFGFGASSIALFARVAGGIYTKAADVGADLVGKVEAGIDEDDPHNPAVIADNVGDNVGDVAGMGADLFESFVGSIIAAATLAKNDRQIALPFFLASAGIFCSMIGMMAVSTKEKGEGKNSNLSALMWALEKGMYTACFFFVIAAFVICFVLDKMYGEFACVVIGLISGALIGKVTEYFTSFDFAPVQSIKDRGKTGPATVVIQGLGVGMLSCVPPVMVLVAAILSCAAIDGNYGVAIAAVGSKFLHAYDSHHGRSLRSFTSLFHFAPSFRSASLPPSASLLFPPKQCWRPSASRSPRTRTGPWPTTPAAWPRWTPPFPARCATRPTPSTRWATLPLPRARGSPSGRRCSRP